MLPALGGAAGCVGGEGGGPGETAGRLREAAAAGGPGRLPTGADALLCVCVLMMLLFFTMSMIYRRTGASEQHVCQSTDSWPDRTHTGVLAVFFISMMQLGPTGAGGGARGGSAWPVY